MSENNGLNERLLPYNADAERSVLGSMLRDKEQIDEVVNILQVEHFYTDAHQKIFQAITSLHDQAKGVDLITLANYLDQQKQIADIGGYAYLGELLEAAPTAANARYYADIVREKGMIRNLIHAGNEILRDAYDQAMSADQLLGEAEQRIMQIAEQGLKGGAVDLPTALKETYDLIDERVQKGASQTVTGIATGFIDLDEKTSGFQHNELTILAARPSVGKTAFAINIVRHAAIEEKRSVFFISLEMSRTELVERLLCCHSRVDSHKLRKGQVGSEDMDKLIEAGGVLRKARVFVDDSAAQGMLRIAANARRLHRRPPGLDLIVIDYLQLIEPENRRDSRQEQVAQVSRRLKFLAKELKIPVLALAQVNRASEDRQDHRPRLADLRESGCLTGDTLVTLADTGDRVPIRELVGRSGFCVWSLDEVAYKLKPAEVSRAFSTGIKPVFRLETGLGRTIKATGNHRFRGMQDWKRLDKFTRGDRIALPSDAKSTSSLASSDVYWDTITSIQPAGEEEVFDLTVPGPANFVANEIVVHNSIEQDADAVLILHRPELYEPGQHEGTIEVIIAKNRHGPTGEITLTFLKQYMRFENFAAGIPFDR